LSPDLTPETAMAGRVSACNGGEVGTPIEFRRLARVELSRVAEIDRTERIDLIYEQRGTARRQSVHLDLERAQRSFSAPRKPRG
jgi:hypothetical protein